MWALLFIVSVFFFWKFYLAAIVLWCVGWLLNEWRKSFLQWLRGPKWKVYTTSLFVGGYLCLIFCSL